MRRKRESQSRTVPRAESPARAALARLVQRHARRVSTSVGAAQANPGPENLHRLRIEIRRMRATLSSLEAELNARLLQRTTRRLSLTDVGHAYYDRCKRILEAFDEANREASDSQSIAAMPWPAAP